ncbi:MAG: hypothetical protein AAGJ19_13840 [Myxococcota bacterium]
MSPDYHKEKLLQADLRVREWLDHVRRMVDARRWHEATIIAKHLMSDAAELHHHAASIEDEEIPF